jgi:hypothetical protein
MSRHHDDDWIDQPYSNADLEKPGFDPYEAHLAWLDRRRERNNDPAYLEARRQAASERIRKALAKFKREPRKPKKPKRIPTESERIVKEWKAALKAAKQKKR